MYCFTFTYNSLLSILPVKSILSVGLFAINISIIIQSIYMQDQIIGLNFKFKTSQENFRRNEKNHKFAMMTPLYWPRMSGLIAIALIFPQSTLEGLVFTIL